MACCFRVFTYKLKPQPFFMKMDYICFKLQVDFRIQEVNKEFTAVALCERYMIFAKHQGPRQGNIQELAMVFFAVV